MHGSILEIVVAFWLVRRQESLLRDTFEGIAARFGIRDCEAVSEYWDLIGRRYGALENPLGVFTFPKSALEHAQRLVKAYKEEESNMALVQLYENVAAQAR